ncbi:MAG: hypothetical protein ACXWUG_03770 [Polyangiales bacterium]
MVDGVDRIALVGGGGSGKSVLAAALGHRLAKRFHQRIHWFRVGGWDAQTLFEMFAWRFGTARARNDRVEGLRAFLSKHPRLIVLDNHEDDRATARLIDELGTTPVTFVITARRCLLSGVLVFPVTAPLATSGKPAFPRVASLTRMLRFNPLALDIADAIVSSRASTARALHDYLDEQGVTRVRVIAHEDDLPEVALLVEWAWARLPAASRRLLSVLAHVDGDHVDGASLGALAGVKSGLAEAIAALLRFRLMQEPLRGRYTLHAVVRYAVAKKSAPDPERLFEHYVPMLERDPSRLRLEQTHLFTAMDFAHRKNDLDAMLRIERILESG